MTIQMVAESWEDALPEDMRGRGRILREIEASLGREDDVRVSHLPLARRFIKMCLNGILDLMV